MLTREQLDEAREIFRQEEAAKKLEKKRKIEEAQKIKSKMTLEEKIKFVNTPYDMMPEELQPGMTKHPQIFNHVRINQPHLGGQIESPAARIMRFRDKYDLSRQEFINICNTYAQKLDLPKKGLRRKQMTRLTMRDIQNYEDFNICPKTDKRAVICKALGITEAHLGGYGTQDVSSGNEILEARFRKNSKKKKYKEYNWENMTA